MVSTHRQIQPHVLIVGGGLGGMVLAQALRKEGISFEIFERDEGLHSRGQGWSISLHWILKDLLASVPSDMPSIEPVSHLFSLGLEAEGCMYKNETGEKVLQIQGDSESRLIRANRAKLRDWLATNLEIQYGKNLERFEETASGVTVFFSDGTSTTGDILVGADGVHSHVRRHLLRDSPRAPQALPTATLMGELKLSKAQYERHMARGRSFYAALGACSSRLFIALKDVSADAEQAEYYWIISWKDPAAAHEPYWTQHASKEELYAAALEHTRVYRPEFRETVELTDAAGMVKPPIVFRDMVPEELPRGRVTLVGDAVHPMTPLRGEGGNHAMKDSLNLAKILTKAFKAPTNATTGQQADLPALLKEYEAEMITRAGDAVLKSRAAAVDADFRVMRDGWANAGAKGKGE